MDGENDTSDHADLFKEPEDFYQPDKPATNTGYVLCDGREIRLRLVGHNPLWVCLAMPHPGHGSRLMAFLGPSALECWPNDCRLH